MMYFASTISAIVLGATILLSKNVLNVSAISLGVNILPGVCVDLLAGDLGVKIGIACPTIGPNGDVEVAVNITDTACCLVELHLCNLPSLTSFPGCVQSGVISANAASVLDLTCVNDGDSTTVNGHATVNCGSSSGGRGRRLAAPLLGTVSAYFNFDLVCLVTDLVKGILDTVTGLISVLNLPVVGNTVLLQQNSTSGGPPISIEGTVTQVVAPIVVLGVVVTPGKLSVQVTHVFGTGGPAIGSTITQNIAVNPLLNLNL